MWNNINHDFIIMRITRMIHMKKMIEIIRTSTSTSTSTIINKMMNFSHKANFVLLSSLTHIVQIGRAHV